MKLPRTFEKISDGSERGLHFGAQVYVSVDCRVVVDTAVGNAWLPGDAPSGADPAVRTDHLTLWMSASKPVGAIAIAQLYERGLADLDAPVAETLPEFGQKGKGAITLRHILTHTGGFRDADLDMTEPDWDEAVRKVCEAPISEGWIVGETAGYHERSSWYILGELVHRLDGRPYPRYVREAIFEPLGMVDSWVGMPRERYAAYGDRIAPEFNTFRKPPVLFPYHEEAVVTSCMPAGNGRGPARELGRFYEALLGGGESNGKRILRSGTVEEFTRPHRVGVFDTTFQHTVDWGLGFIVDSNRHGTDTVPYGYGRHSSPRAFGHGGRQSVAAFADPEYDLVAVIWFNGMPGEPRHNKRNRDVLTALYEDLGFVEGHRAMEP